MVRIQTSRLQRRLLDLGMRSVKGSLQVGRLHFGDTICRVVVQSSLGGRWSMNIGQLALSGQADPSRLSDGGNNFGVPLPCRPQLRDNLHVIADQFGLGSRQGMIKGLPVLSELSDPSRTSDGGNKLRVPLPCRIRGSG